MKRIYHILCILIAGFMIITVLSGCNDGKSDNQGGNMENDGIEVVNFKEYFSNLKLDTQNEVFYIEGDSLSTEERILFSSLQGVVAKTDSAFFIKYSGATTDWFNSLKIDYSINFTKISKPYELLEKYKNKVKDFGYVTYEFVGDKYKTAERKDAESVNNACTIAGQESYLVVAEKLEEKVSGYGFSKKEDGKDYTSYELFEKYKDNLNKGFLMHQRFNNFQLRDFGISIGALFFYSYNEETSVELEQIHEWLNPLAVINGWYEDEVGGVKLSSSKGNITVPSDYATNFTVYAALTVSEDQPLKQKDYDAKYAGNDKHYVAFMLTDGDNITYHLNNVYKDKGYNEKVERTVPVSWTFIPMAYDLAPHLAKYYYRTMTSNDNFVASLSGVGYINPGYWPKDQLNIFAKTTAEYMGKMDESVMAMLIDGANAEELTKGSNPGINTLQTIADSFSPYDSIKGGFFYFGSEYVPDKDYEGTVTWSKGKPFINLRGGTWFAGTDVNRDEELAKLAYKLNHRTKDASKTEGYSVLVISAGTQNAYTEDLLKISRMLDKNVVVVTCEELVDIMTENVAVKETNYRNNDSQETAFHFNLFNFSNDYKSLMYNYMKINTIIKQEPSDVLVYDFSTDKGGWTEIQASKYEDTSLAEFSSGKYHTLSNGEKRDDYIPDSYLFNKINLPDKDGLKMVINASYNNADIRVRVYADGRFYTVYDYIMQSTNGEYRDLEIDISKYKGTQASIIYEVRNGESYTSGIIIK